MGKEGEILYAGGLEKGRKEVHKGNRWNKSLIFFMGKSCME